MTNYSKSTSFPNTLIRTINYDGYVFDNFTVDKDPSQGPGWYVFGHNSEKYGINDENGRGRYVMLCARPDVPARNHPHYNIRVQRGWKTKSEAQDIADKLNQGVL